MTVLTFEQPVEQVTLPEVFWIDQSNYTSAISMIAEGAFGAVPKTCDPETGLTMFLGQDGHGDPVCIFVNKPENSQGVIDDYWLVKSQIEANQYQAQREALDKKYPVVQTPTAQELVSKMSEKARNLAGSLGLLDGVSIRKTTADWAADNLPLPKTETSFNLPNARQVAAGIALVAILASSTDKSGNKKHDNQAVGGGSTRTVAASVIAERAKEARLAVAPTVPKASKLMVKSAVTIEPYTTTTQPVTTTTETVTTTIEPTTTLAPVHAMISELPTVAIVTETTTTTETTVAITAATVPESATIAPPSLGEKLKTYEQLGSAELAKKILEYRKKGLIRIQKGSGVLRSLQDLIDDGKVQTTNSHTKEVLYVDGNPKLLGYVLLAAEQGLKPDIHSLTTGGHSKDSDHWKANGIDFGLNKQLAKWTFDNHEELGVNKSILHPSRWPKGYRNIFKGNVLMHSDYDKKKVLDEHLDHLHVSIFAEPNQTVIRVTKKNKATIPQTTTTIEESQVVQEPVAVQSGMYVEKKSFIKLPLSSVNKVDNPSAGNRAQDEAVSDEEIADAASFDNDTYKRVMLGGQDIKATVVIEGVAKTIDVPLDRARFAHYNFVLKGGKSVDEMLDILLKRETEIAQSKFDDLGKISEKQVQVIDGLKLSVRQKAFMREIVPGIQQAYYLGLKINPEVVLSQAALESTYGKQAPGHNYFGVKAGSGWNGDTVRFYTHEYIKGRRVGMYDKFRAYNNPVDAIRDYARLIANNDNYNDAQANYKDPVAYVRGLQRGGNKYATDIKYEQKMARMRKFLHTNELFTDTSF